MDHLELYFLAVVKGNSLTYYRSAKSSHLVTNMTDRQTDTHTDTHTQTNRVIRSKT